MKRKRLGFEIRGASFQPWRLRLRRAGSEKLGLCLTDAAREIRSRRTARVFPL
jgi:hypothetical protein